MKCPIEWKITGDCFISDDGNFAINVKITGEKGTIMYKIEPDEKTGRFENWEEKLKDLIDEDLKKVRNRRKANLILKGLMAEKIRFKEGKDGFFIITKYKKSSKSLEKYKISVELPHLSGMIKKSIILEWKDVSEENIRAEFQKEIGIHEHTLKEVKKMKGRTFCS